jgi:hypothetical protein
MTVLEVEELTGYWTDHPPLHLLLAAYLGRQRGRPAASSKLQLPGRSPNGTAEQLLADFGPAFVSADVHAGLGTVSLDISELRKARG